MTDGISSLIFDFDDSCDVAHAAFQAMHDGVEERIIGGACNWRPKAVQGVQPPTDGDSFFYGDSFGIKSLLLDGAMPLDSSEQASGLSLCFGCQVSFVAMSQTTAATAPHLWRPARSVVGLRGSRRTAGAIHHKVPRFPPESIL